MAAAALTVLAAFVTAFAASVAYNGFLLRGDPRQAAAWGLVGGVITIAHGLVTAGLFRGWAWARQPALLIFGVWIVAGLALFAAVQKSNGHWFGLGVAAVSSFGLANLLLAMRRPR